RGISLAFAREGSKVVIAEIDPAQGQKVVAEIETFGGKASVIACDVTKRDQVMNMVQTTLNMHGTIDVLVNNVGWSYDSLFIEKPWEVWDKEIQVNFQSDINCIRTAVDTMIANRQGVILSISSDAGRMGEYREAVYSGCKGAVIAMSKSLARELGRYNIRVNVVCPSLTVPATDEEVGANSLWREPGMKAIFTPEAVEKAKKSYPLRRLGTPEDIANAIVFLASNSCAGFITGQTLSVDGGYTMM
ncbi:MAG: SDR family NAD(P)-dependent oxidoreductase, partial [Dehalococcoidia bacterium]|nr:SDR family NAD(P)-dependent oxidoreductase [Dehalococcoidia bacterium]